MPDGRATSNRVWTPDRREGVWMLTDDDGDLFDIGGIVFQSRHHAQQWADEFAPSTPVAPRLAPKMVGFLRPPGWNFNV